MKIVWMCTAFSLTRFKGTELRKLMYSWDRVTALAPAAILIKLDSIPDLLCDFFMDEEATETIEFVQPKAWGKSCTKLLHECLVIEVPEARKELKWNAILLTKVRPSLYWGLSKHIMLSEDYSSENESARNSYLRRFFCLFEDNSLSFV